MDNTDLMSDLDQLEIQKIAILGLPNAGKTSIIKTILARFQELEGLTPTKSVDRTKVNFLGRALIIWDFGGQSRFTRNYFRNPEKYFQAIEYVYYVIDSQDEAKLQESQEYFLKIFEVVSEFNDDVKFSLVFHKRDPKYDGKVDFSLVERLFISNVIPKITLKAKALPDTFYTSIYDPMSVISAISQPLLANNEIHKNLSLSIEQFCKENNLLFGILFTRNFLELGNFFSLSKEIQIKEVLHQLMKEHKIQEMEKEVSIHQSPEMFVVTQKLDLIGVMQTIPFYFVFGFSSGDLSIDSDEIKKKVHDYTDNLKYFIQHAELLSYPELTKTGLVKSEFFDH